MGKRCKRCGGFLKKDGSCSRDHTKMTYQRIYKRNCNVCKKYYEGRGAMYCGSICQNKITSPFKKGVNHPYWKGDDVGLSALHEWMFKRKFKPVYCECCKKVPPYDLSSNEHTYTRDPKDWEWLCRSCHKKKDIKQREVNKNSS